MATRKKPALPTGNSASAKDAIFCAWLKLGADLASAKAEAGIYYDEQQWTTLVNRLVDQIRQGTTIVKERDTGLDRIIDELEEALLRRVRERYQGDGGDY